MKKERKYPMAHLKGRNKYLPKLTSRRASRKWRRRTPN